MDQAGAQLSLMNVSFAYDEGARRSSPVFDSLSLTLPRSSFTTILGPSGCGKSTLIRLMSGLLRPKAGSILLDEESPAAMLGKRGIALVPQQADLLGWKTALQNVELPGRLWRDSAVTDRARQALRAVGLSSEQDAYPGQLSVGMQARVSVARACCQEPQLLLLDEPFAALDEPTRYELNKQILDFWERRRSTTVLVTHSIPDAIFCSNRIILLGNISDGVIGNYEVKLRRPRDLSSFDDPAYLSLLATLRSEFPATTAVSAARPRRIDQ